MIRHNGQEKGCLYIMDERVETGRNICQHPGMTMDQNAEFLAERSLRVRLLHGMQEKPVRSGVISSTCRRQAFLAKGLNFVYTAIGGDR